jgi:hypothetical protein
MYLINCHRLRACRIFGMKAKREHKLQMPCVVSIRQERTRGGYVVAKPVDSGIKIGGTMALQLISCVTVPML